ncbi:hypothetical protein ACIRF8_15140 [Streptomyces sp. NPDC102406]|uniref:hypothetical protein n=1 Tax=Streptomyces sp. NPDC102406 TaxID=3366171 RepID=UPI0037F2F3AD
MKEDLLEALDVYVTVFEVATWVWITCAIGLSAAGAALIAAAIRRILAAFADANRLIDEISQPRKETPQS